MWWEMLPVVIAAWALAIAGVIYISRQILRVTIFGKKVAAALARLILIGTTDKWPNGAKNLPDAMDQIYIRQGQTHDLLESYIVAHRADHELPR